MSKRIFIVEDDVLASEQICEFIEEAGYEVAGKADNGADALKQIRQTSPDLVLMDIRLRGAMDGIDIAGNLSASSQIPVIYLTAYSDADIVERAKLTLPYGYLLKPFTRNELKVSIEVALYKSEMDAELRRWQEITIGREMRIIEIMNEVNELLTQAGNPPRYHHDQPETSDLAAADKDLT